MTCYDTCVMRKMFLTTVVLLFVFFLSSVGTGICAPVAKTQTTNPLIKFLKEIEYTSRLKFEFDDNIFLTEDNQDSDFKQIFSQGLNYELSKEKQYFRLEYFGNYSYLDEESLGILGHAADVVYSYRPFDKFSVGFRNDFKWLQDTKVTSVIGDRVLALGYTQVSPSVQLKYEINPQYNVSLDLYDQILDARDPVNDDYIDNQQYGVTGRLNYNFAPEYNMVAFMGLGQRQTEFAQIAEKSSSSLRPFFGLTKKFNSLLNLTQEFGFENVRMEENGNASSNNADSRTSLETTFSIYTKLKVSYDHNVNYPSLRSDYAQYKANTASLGVIHAINPKTSLAFDYSYTRQAFNGGDALIGKTKEDRDTFIQTLGTTLTRKLPNGVALDFKYSYNKRDTDFAAEGYTDNKVSVALTAKY